MYNVAQQGVDISKLGMKLIEKVLAMILLSLIYTISRIILVKMGIVTT